MTDGPAGEDPADTPDDDAPLEPSTAADEPAGAPDATSLNSADAAGVVTQRRADRTQQVLTASVLLLIAASAVLLAISIAKQ